MATLQPQRLTSEEAPPKRLRPLATSPTIESARARIVSRVGEREKRSNRRGCLVHPCLRRVLTKKKTCSGRMAGKEKENMKRKGKQRLVGEMAIRWIAIVHFCKFSCWRFFFFST